jgi:hypothetical protein
LLIFQFWRFKEVIEGRQCERGNSNEYKDVLAKHSDQDWPQKSSNTIESIRKRDPKSHILLLRGHQKANIGRDNQNIYEHIHDREGETLKQSRPHIDHNRAEEGHTQQANKGYDVVTGQESLRFKYFVDEDCRQGTDG